MASPKDTPALKQIKRLAALSCMSMLIETIRRFWCRQFHHAIMLPVHGAYRCQRCLRQYEIPWELENARHFRAGRSGLREQAA